MKRCTNNAVKKATEVVDAMRRFGNYDGMNDLYRRGCLRHIEDVAYAWIMLEKHKQSVEEIAAHLDARTKVLGHALITVIAFIRRPEVL